MRTVSAAASIVAAISRKAAAVSEAGAFWMGRGGFFTYAGGAVQAIACDVRDFVFNDLNRSQQSKVHAVANAEFGEIWWFYPGDDSTECNRYVAYNYREGHWLIGAIDRTSRLMRNAAVLESITVPQHTADSIPVTYLDANNARQTRWVAYVGDAETSVGWNDAGDTELLRRPLYRRLEGNYAYEYSPDHRIMYVRFASVEDAGDENIADFFARVFAFVDTADVERFVLDIRDIQGGNNYLIEPVVQGLIKSEKINVPGKLFVIIGRNTFSAGMCLAVEIEKNTPAVFVGEPTGGRPNHFGSPEDIVLPESGITVRCSGLYLQNSDPRDQRPGRRRLRGTARQKG